VCLVCCLRGTACGEHAGAVAGERLIHLNHSGQYFVLDLHEARRVGCMFFGVGCHRGNLVSLIHDDTARGVRGISPKERCLDAGSFLRGDRSTDTIRARGCGDRTILP
jgi:hypothetical protein